MAHTKSVTVGPGCFHLSLIGKSEPEEGSMDWSLTRARARITCGSVSVVMPPSGNDMCVYMVVAKHIRHGLYNDEAPPVPEGLT